MLPPVKPVGITEFRDSSTKPDLPLFWTRTDIADSANAGHFSVSSGVTGIISKPEAPSRQMICKCPVCGTGQSRLIIVLKFV